MGDWEKTIIPLDHADEILTRFDVDLSSRESVRWRRDDGFRHVDFEGVLNQSSLILMVDWRGGVQDIAEEISRQLQRLGIAAKAESQENDDQAKLQADGKSIRIIYNPNQDDDFDRVMTQVNALIQTKAHYRKLRSCEGSDGWVYAVLKNEDWAGVESEAGKTMKLLFVSIG